MIYHPEDLINVREAARQCGRNAETIRRWIWGGKLPAEKLGNQLFIKKKNFALFCRETATLVYRPEPNTGFLEQAEKLRRKFKARGEKPINTGKLTGQMREEHMNELDERYTYNSAEIKATGTAGFIERAIQFRKKLKARGYPGIDAAGLVRKTREGRMSELRQSLR
jgi:hypothetical protein